MYRSIDLVSEKCLKRGRLSTVRSISKGEKGVYIGKVFFFHAKIGGELM